MLNAARLTRHNARVLWLSLSIYQQAIMAKSRTDDHLGQDSPFLFLAEGVLMYFEEAQVKSLAVCRTRAL
jgi:O-methyltransferase involved in polyketide biosynthesis